MCSSHQLEAVIPIPINHYMESLDDRSSADEGRVNQHHAGAQLFKLVPMRKVSEKLISLTKTASPIIMTSLILYSRSLISMLFLGVLGDTQLAGGTLAIGFANITGYSVLKGLATGMEPICCQAYGARNWALLNQTYKKTLCLLFLTVIPISLLWLNLEPILLWFGQDQNITSVAKVYITYSIPDLLAQAIFHPLRTYLRTQKINQPLTVCTFCGMLLHILINYILVMVLDMGVKGIALASAWSTLNLNLGLFIYLIISSRPLKPWSRSYRTATLSDSWKPLLALAGPSMLSVCLEWWWYELMIMMCGIMSNCKENVAAMGILIQLTGLLYAVPSSLSSSLSIHVGHELGAGRPAQAKETTMIGLAMAILWGFTAFIFTTSISNLWGKLYTSDPQILYLISIAMPILGLCELGNSTQTSACGILIGSARPKIGCFINFGSFYIIGLPIAALMGFYFKVGFLGVWYGLAAAQLSCLCMMIYSMVCTDWTEQARRARELTQATEVQRLDLEANLLC